MDILERARDYLAKNAAESGACVLIRELCDEVERLRKSWIEDVGKLLNQVGENKAIIDDATKRLDRAGL